jgi:hypothetical protein
MLNKIVCVCVCTQVWSEFIFTLESEAKISLIAQCGGSYLYQLLGMQRLGVCSLRLAQTKLMKSYLKNKLRVMVRT